MAWEIVPQKDTTTLVEAVASAWKDWIHFGAGTGRRRSVALGGGRVFGRFLETAARLLAPERAGLDELDFFWGDERCVPPDSDDSNFRLGRERFLQPLGISAQQIHRLRGEAMPEEAARAAEVVLRVATGTRAGQIPELDLVFLGLGEDGHVASLFPEAPAEVTDSTAVFLPVIGPKPPPQRLTLSYPMLARAREVWVIASGAGKVDALRESLRDGGTTPLARVLRERAQTRIYTDIQS